MTLSVQQLITAKIFYYLPFSRNALHRTLITNGYLSNIVLFSDIQRLLHGRLCINEYIGLLAPYLRKSLKANMECQADKPGNITVGIF